MLSSLITELITVDSEVINIWLDWLLFSCHLLIVESTDIEIVGHALEVFADTLHQFWESWAELRVLFPTAVHHGVPVYQCIASYNVINISSRAIKKTSYVWFTKIIWLAEHTFCRYTQYFLVCRASGHYWVPLPEPLGVHQGRELCQQWRFPNRSLHKTTIIMIL